MHFGLCCAPEEAPAAIAAGFDYVELPGWLLPAREAEYAGLKCEATNLFFPPGTELYGIDEANLLAQAQARMWAASRVGVRVMVIGSGAARRSTPEKPPEPAEASFVNIVGQLQRSAPPALGLAPESLCLAETDVGTSLPDLARALAVQGVGFTADAYHVLREAEDEGYDPSDPWFWETQLPCAPTHVHLANRRREVPDPDDCDLIGFVRRLENLGFEGRVSLECSVGAGELVAALASVRALFREN